MRFIGTSAAFPCGQREQRGKGEGGELSPRGSVELHADALGTSHEDGVSRFLGLRARRHALDRRKGCLGRKAFDGDRKVVNRFDTAGPALYGHEVASRSHADVYLRRRRIPALHAEQLLVELLRGFQIVDGNLYMVDAGRQERTGRRLLRRRG